MRRIRPHPGSARNSPKGSVTIEFLIAIERSSTYIITPIMELRLGTRSSPSKQIGEVIDYVAKEAG